MPLCLTRNVRQIVVPWVTFSVVFTNLIEEIIVHSCDRRIVEINAVVVVTDEVDVPSIGMVAQVETKGAKRCIALSHILVQTSVCVLTSVAGLYIAQVSIIGIFSFADYG